MKIRVAHILTPTFGLVFSGHTHYIFSLLSGWKDDQISLDLFGTQIKPLNQNTGDRNYQLPPGEFWSIPKRLDRKSRIKWSFDLLWMLLKRRKDYDIVHFHSLGWGALLSPFILHLLGKKAIFTMSLMGNDNPSYISQQPRGKLQVALLRQFDGAIGLSPAIAQDAIKHSIKNVICLPNFLVIPELEEDPDDKEILQSRKIIRRQLDVSPESQLILFIGSVIYRKGVDLLIEAFIRIAERFPKAVLVMVGPNNKLEKSNIDESFVNTLKEEVQSSGFTKRVKWVGMVKEQTKMVDFYRTADIFILPTRNEGSPNVLAEALSAGLPVISSLLPGITDEIIKHEENGMLVEVNDISGFEMAIEDLLKNENKRSALGNLGRELALEKFGFDSYCKQLKKFYLDIYYGNN